MNLRYLIPRLVRHFMPEGLARLLLRRRWLIRPGLETSDPITAVDHYLQALNQAGMSLDGKRALVFGYGGRFALGVELLRKGAAQVVLCDHIASIDNGRNLQLLPQYEKYLWLEQGVVKPRPECITLLHGDIRDQQLRQRAGAVDYVFSTSVYEHLDDVEGITSALAALARPDGMQVHFVDLRDHFFKYPFEMLSYSKSVWYGWLNPSSNHNRYRIWDYRRAFESSFKNVEISVLGRDETGFEKARSRIRPEFVSGKPADDSVTLIRVVASQAIK